MDIATLRLLMNVVVPIGEIKYDQKDKSLEIEFYIHDRLVIIDYKFHMTEFVDEMLEDAETVDTYYKMLSSLILCEFTADIVKDIPLSVYGGPN